MAKYSYTYRGAQAAFILAGVSFSNGVAVLVEEQQHKILTENKFAKHLVDAGELTLQEIAEPKPTAKTTAKE